MFIPRRSELFSVLSIVFFFLVCIGSLLNLHFRVPYLYWNHTASEPIGLYLAVPGAIHVGDKIIMKVPENMEEYCYGRGWLRDNEPMLKTIYAVKGDQYKITEDAIYINDVEIGKVSKEDLKGLPLPKKTGEYLISDGKFLPIAAEKKNSFDGRYFGDVPIGLIITKVIPIFTIPEWFYEKDTHTLF